MIENSKLAIIGAGSVGSSLAYAALIRGSAREIVLYDMDRAKAEAEVLDLAHGTPFTGAGKITGGGDIEAVAGAKVVVITAGAKQQPGQTRLDLAGTNARILGELLPKLVELAPRAVFILVTNPCDVLTVAAQGVVDLPPGRILSSGTLLDSARLRWLIAEKAGVSAASVHAAIIGEHGDSEFPLWSQAKIGPTPLLEWTDEHGKLVFDSTERARLHEEVVGSAYKVIAGKGATNYAIGLSGARIVEAILRDEKAVLTVSTVLNNYNGVDGVALSVPVVVGKHGVERVLDVPMNDSEAAHFRASAEALHQSIQALGIDTP